MSEKSEEEKAKDYAEFLKELFPEDPETDGVTIHRLLLWKNEVIPIRWQWCPVCIGPYVECRCGNNLCSGGGSCEDCKEFYEIQDHLYAIKEVPTREDFVKLKKISETIG